MSAQEIASLMNLYVAEYTGDGFSTPNHIGNTGTWKYDYHLTENDGILCAIWAENSENDIMLTSGSTKIYESRFTNNTRQQATQLASMNEILTEVESGMVGDTFTKAYIKGNQVYIGEKIFDISEVAENAQIADSLAIQNGKLYVRIDGKLCSYDGIELKDRKVECSTSYQIYDGSVYWMQQNNFKSEIMRKPLDSEANPVAITDEGGYVGGFTIVHNAEGKPVLTYTYQQVKEETQDENPYGLTLLKFTEDLTRYQAEVTNVAYDILSLTTGEENLLDVTVCNTGTDEIHQVVLTIQDGDTVLYNDVVANSMISGEMIECSVPVSIPENFSKDNLTFSLQAEEDFKKDSSQSCEIETCLADVEITSNGTDEVIVKNNALDTAKDVTVIARNENENGAEIRKIPVGVLEAGESKKISIQEDWVKAVKLGETNKKYLYCEVTQQGDEYELWNNSIVIERLVSEGDPSEPTEPSQTPESSTSSVSSEPVKVSQITLSGLSKQIAAGKKIKLMASVLPKNTSNKTVTWKSNNTKVATVNSSGVVTMNKKSGGKSVTITATAKDGSGIKTIYKIKSMKGVVKKVSISGSKSVKARKSLKLKAKVTATKGANKKLKWTSSNTKYATVTSSGKVKTFRAGKGKKVKITAMATDGSNKKKTVTIKIK